MDLQEKAKIVALTKTLGCELSAKEILEKYSQYFQEALDEFGEEPVEKAESAKASYFKRTF